MTDPVSRRRLLMVGGAGAMAAAALAVQAPRTLAAGVRGTRIPFDPSVPRQSSMGFLKFAGSQGNETVRRWYTGKVLAWLPGEPTREIFQFEGFNLGRFWRNDDGTHGSTIHEITIKRDPRTGQLLKEWSNPFTGRVDKVMNSIGGPQERVYNEWGWDRPEKARRHDNPRRIDWTIVDDTAWLTWDLLLRMPNPVTADRYPLESSGAMLDLVNLTTYTGSLSDLEDPNVLNAPAILAWNGVTSWEPWMRMGQRPGWLLYRTIGVKVADFRDIPADVFAATEAAFPGCLEEKVPWPDGQYLWADFVGGKFFQD